MRTKTRVKRTAANRKPAPVKRASANSKPAPVKRAAANRKPVPVKRASANKKPVPVKRAAASRKPAPVKRASAGAAAERKPASMFEAVILAGGRGERFWPLSRRGVPKQFLPLADSKSLLAETWARLRLRLEPGEIRVIAAEDLRARTLRELPELDERRFIGEAVGRNTAPAVALAAGIAWRDKVDRVQLVVPADHWIGDVEAFWATVDRACAVARADDGPLVTLGIPITRPETGYGYIERGPARMEAPGAFQVLGFREKPDRETAAAYQQSGRHLWNSGIFVWRLSALLRELAHHMPELSGRLDEVLAARDPRRRISAFLRSVEAQSIDYGLLERSSRVVVVEAGFAWSDLGNWRSWGERRAGDNAGNVVRGRAIALDAGDCTLYAGDGLIAVLGVRDLIVVQAGGITLIMPRERSQEVRRLLEALRARGEWDEFL